MGLPFVAALFYFVLFSEHPVARVLYGLTKLFTLIWPVLAFRFILHGRWRPVRWRDPAHVRSIPLGAAVGVGVGLLAFGLMQTPLGEVVRASGGSIRAKAVELGILDHYWTFALFLALMHSLLEEYYWRWFVFGQLRRVIPVAGAHALAATSFAAHHVVIATQFFPVAWGVVLGAMVGVGGFLFSWLYARQGTLIGAWTAHALIDLALLWIGYGLVGGG